MKKRNGKRILAGFLALLLVLSSFTWDFGGADVAKAEDAATAITETEDSLNINFENIDITELEDSGYTSTRFKNSAALVGEVNQQVSEHWFAGDGTDTPYGDADETTITGKNSGLKSNDVTDSNTRTIMYTPCSYEDFIVSAEVYYGAYTGIVIGEKNVYPTESNDVSSVVLFFNSGRINIMGAVDRDSAKITRGSKAAIANNGDSVGYKIFNNGSGDTIKSDAGNVYTINVKKTGNHLIVWYSGGTGAMIIKLTDAYKTGAIGIQSRAYDGDNGGFKSLSIEKVHATETHNLDNADVTELDNLGYSATFGGTVVNNSVGNAFFSGTSNSTGTLTSANEGLKGTTTGTSVSGLNIPYIYENFRLEAEVYSGQLIGVAAGDASSYPRSSDKKMLSAFYNMNGGKIMLQMEGAYSGSWTRVGGAAGTNGTQWRPTLNGSVPADTRNVVYTIVLEVRDGKATIWMEGYDGYVTASVADTYTTEKISLIARHSSNDKGGIKGYTITNLDAGDTQDFDNVVLSNLDAAGYTARADGTSELTSVSDSGLWFSGDSTNYADTEKYKNIGLKPSNTNTTREILNMPHAYENFRLKTEVYHGQVLGVKIGLEEKDTQVGGGTVTSGSVSIYINGENLAICGAINYATAELNGASTSLNKSGCIQYKPTGNSAKWNQARTLIVEVQDGILSVSFEDLNHTLKVKLDSSYVAESIAFFARRYDTSDVNAGGGLKGYTIEKLPSANTGTTVDIAGYTDFDYVDTAALEAKGFTASLFDTANANAVVGADQPVSTYWAVGNDVISENDGIKPKAMQSDHTMTLLNTPYEYKDFRVSTEVYWGASTGIVLGAKNVLPGSTTDSAVRIFFNANQIQLTGAGIDPNTAVVTGGTATWNPSYLTTFIFKPDASFTVTKGSVYKLNVEMKDGTITVWVDGYDGVLSIKTTETFKQESIALMGRQFDGDGGGLKSLKVEELGDMVMPYTAVEFATYRSAEGYTAPTYKNYLFSGWFTDPACTKETAVSANTTTVDGTVYAKFVPRYVLGVKAQVSAHLLDDNLKDDTSGGIRFLTTIDSLAYSQVGFKVSYDKGDGNGVQNKTSASNKVYKNLFVTIGDAEGGTVEKDPKEFCDASILFKACTIKTVTEDLYDMEFTVTPFWKTIDGTVVNGTAVVKTVDQGINHDRLKGKTALFVGDSIQAGGNFNAENATPKAWAQRMERYGVVSENVAQKGWALTNKETSGRSQIVTQLDNATLAEYDFVILEGGVNDVRIDQDTQDPDITIDWGAINEDPNATFSADNIAGAMQDLIVKTQAKFPNATIVYMINHYYGANETNMANYVAMVKTACRVHGISYVDFSDTETYPTLEPLTKKSAEYIPDNLHPNAAAYELTTPILATHMRKLLTGELVDTVYVSSTGTDAKGYGTETAPYQTLNYAVSKVNDGGMIYVKNTLTCTEADSTYYFIDSSYNHIESASNVINKVNNKQVTIAGYDDTAILDFSSENGLALNESVILKDIQVKWPSRVRAEGNTFIVEESVTQGGTIEPMVIAGSHYHNLDKTDIRLYAGTYKMIMGGQLKNTVGETHVIVGGSVNSGIDATSHDHTYILYGGCYNEGGLATVSGDTYVTVEEGAKFNYVYGAGGRSSSSKVLSVVAGETNIDFSGEAYGVFGGAYGLDSNSTNVKITGGTVYQVFGGSEEGAVTGNTNVQILAGTVRRRIFGGSYNDQDKDTAFYVSGQSTVTLDPAATLNLTEGSCQSVAAISRHKTPYDNEVGVFIINDYENNTTNCNKIGIDSLLTSWYDFDSKTHDHLVLVGNNGTVASRDGKLYVTPDSGYIATVVYGANNTEITSNEDGSYTLPVEDSTITVTFSASAE